MILVSLHHLFEFSLCCLQVFRELLYALCLGLTSSDGLITAALWLYLIVGLLGTRFYDKGTFWLHLADRAEADWISLNRHQSRWHTALFLYFRTLSHLLVLQIFLNVSILVIWSENRAV